MSKDKTNPVLRMKAREILNDWLMAKGYEIARYDDEDATYTIVTLGTIITALNYAPEYRKKYRKKYQAAKALYHQVHSALREWEIENCKEMPFENFPSEMLRREVQKSNDECFRGGLRDIEKYLENIDIKLVLTIGRKQKKKKKKK